jgi:hypothetical protein
MMKRKNIYRSDFLFTRSSFLTGAGSVLNISGNYFPFNYSKSDEDADSKAIEFDWGMVGLDLEKVYSSNKNIDKLSI